MNRSTIMLLALLVVLGAITYFVLPSDEERSTSYKQTPVSFSVDSASVTGFSIERPGKTITIENVGGRWTITSDGNLPADPARVTEIIGGFSRFKTGSLVSTNTAKQSLFQVDSSGSLVTLTERSGAKHSIIVGKMGPSFSEVYFRLPRDVNVYLGSGVTTWSLGRDVKEWRDKTIFASPPEAITGLTLAAGGKVRAFVKDSSGWKSGQEAVPTETINPVLTTLSNLRAEDFIDSSVQFTGTPSKVQVSGAINATIDFYRMGTDTNRYAVQVSNSPQKYIVGKFVATQLFKPVGEPKSPGVASTRKAPPQPERREITKAAPPAGTRSATETGAPARQPAKTEPVPADTRDLTRQAVQPPARRPAESNPGGSETVNPFKQKAPGERQQPAESVTPPVTRTTPGQGTGRQQAPQVKTPDAGRQLTPPVKTPDRGGQQTPARPPATPPGKIFTPSPAQGGADDEGELTVHVVKKGETMTTIAKQYGVTVEQILKWNLLKSISVTPGQELYIFVRK
jgi:LysM repeat protein